jgi:hypothetical protein
MILVAVVPGPSHVKKVKAYLQPFIQELRKYAANTSGFECEDFSRSSTDPLRFWRFMILLLNILGELFTSVFFSIMSSAFNFGSIP